MSSVNITIRVEEETKKQFDAFCENVGMNVTTAFHLFMKTVLRTRELPFTITDIDPYEQETNQIMLRAKDALRNMQSKAVKFGLSDMSLEEINEEIAAYRREKQKL